MLWPRGAHQANILRGRPQHDAKLARRDCPAVLADTPDRKAAVIEAELGRRASARIDAQPLEALQLLGRLARRRRKLQVKLHDLFASTRARVFDRALDRPSIDAQVAVFECGVGEAVPEGERGLDVMRGVPAVPDLEPLRVQRDAVARAKIYF